VKKGEYPVNKGISYLQVKLQLLLNYSMNISFYLALKAEGKSVKDHPVIDHLVKLRTILEKTSPLDKKLKYQIDKLLKTAAIGNINHRKKPFSICFFLLIYLFFSLIHKVENDPRRFKPKLEALVKENEKGEAKN
jgi:hypothetical protein